MQEWNFKKKIIYWSEAFIKYDGTVSGIYSLAHYLTQGPPRL